MVFNIFSDAGRINDKAEEVRAQEQKAREQEEEARKQRDEAERKKNEMKAMLEAEAAEQAVKDSGLGGRTGGLFGDR